MKYLTVGELIEKLKVLNPTTNVVRKYSDGKYYFIDNSEEFESDFKEVQGEVRKVVFLL